MTLAELARKHNTDKFSSGYAWFYSLFLEPIRETVGHVLEIGVGSSESMQHVPGYRAGASLRMWADYFPHAMVYGADNDARALEECETTARVLLFQCDQNRHSDLLELGQVIGKPLDMIVDDGEHTAIAALRTFDVLYRRVKEGGFYLIEDAGDLYWPLRDRGIPNFACVQTAGGGNCVVIPKWADSTDFQAQ